MKWKRFPRSWPVVPDAISKKLHTFVLSLLLAWPTCWTKSRCVVLTLLWRHFNFSMRFKIGNLERWNGRNCLKLRWLCVRSSLFHQSIVCSKSYPGSQQGPHPALHALCVANLPATNSSPQKVINVERHASLAIRLSLDCPIGNEITLKNVG